MKLRDVLEDIERGDPIALTAPRNLNGWERVDDLPDLLWDFLEKRHASEWYSPAYKKIVNGVEQYIVTTNNGHYYKSDGQSDFVGKYAMQSTTGEDRPTASSSYMLPRRHGQTPSFAEFKGVSVVGGHALIGSDDEMKSIRALAT